MSTLPKNRFWAAAATCAAITFTNTGSFAQQSTETQPYEIESDDAQQQSSDEGTQESSDRQTAEQGRQQADQQQSAEQNQQRARQDQQRAEQRTRQARQRGAFPQPNREAYRGEGRFRDRLWGRERDSSRTGRERNWSRENPGTGAAQRGGDEAGLGVTIDRDSRDGVTVVDVYRDSPAEQMGIQPGDRITQINGRDVQSGQQFISQIRQMSPGEEISLEASRGDEQRTFRGRLESRWEALVSRGERAGGPARSDDASDTWQTGYEEQRGRIGAAGVDRQIGQIERHLDQLTREIDELRYAVRDLRQQANRGSRETTARYEEYRDRDRDTRTDGIRRGSPRASGDWQGDGPEFDDTQSSERSYLRRGDQSESDRAEDGSQYRESYRMSSDDDSSGPRFSTEDQSIGGEIGEERLHPDNDLND